MENLGIVALVVLFLFFMHKKTNKSSSLGREKARNSFQQLPENEKNAIEKCIKDVLFIVKNNIKFLPKDVIELEYTKKTINAFVWYYNMTFFVNKFSQEKGFMLLTLIMDELEKEGILKFEDFDIRIFRDERFKTMPTMIGLFGGASLNDNTLILVFVEQYMESLTGKKVRYMNQNANNAEKRKVASINGIELSQENDMNILDRPDKTQEYWMAREQVGCFLQERFKKYDGFKWIRVEPMSPKFDDMSFAYKNKIFSVLIDIKYSDDDLLSKQERDRFVKECTSNNLVPCIFPINDKQSISLLSNEHWNLYDIRTNEIINPLTVATDEKIMMSEYEFNNMAVDIVKNYIRKDKMKLESYCDILGIFPQIWFNDKNNEMSWVYVNYSTTGKFRDINPELNKLIKGMPQFNGYMAQVGLICAETGGPYRGAGFYIKFNGIEKIYAAHRDAGHGYGVNVKLQ